MKHLGDITKISGYTAPPVDVITCGSPCQDLSVAGKRAGLAGERSGLFMEQIRIIKEMRENDRRAGRADELVRPRYMVWENVPGAFSSNGGEDFRAVLEETAKIADQGAVIPRPPAGKWQPAGCIVGDGWSIAWRLHDAQFWGVPQRRKRIALVADFGGSTAPEILFERKGVSRDTEPGGTEREETAGAAGGGVEGASWGIDHVITTGGNCTAQGPCVYEEVEATLKAAGPHAVCSAISFQERAGKPGGGKGILIQQERTGALSTLNNQSVCLPINTMVATRDNDEKRTTFGIGSDGDPQFSITSAHEHGVCVAQGCDVYNQEITGEVAASLTAASGGSNTSGPKAIVKQPDVFTIDEKCGTTYVHQEKGNTLGARDYKQPQAVVYDASRRHDYKQSGDVCETVQSQYGTGGNNTPIVLEGNGTRESHKGDGYAESETMYTLNTIERHAVAYGISAYDSNAMKSNNPHSGVYKAETSRTLDLNGGSPACNQGGIAVCQPPMIEMTSTKNTICEDGISPYAVCFEPEAVSRVGGHIYNDGVAGTVRANAGDNQQAVVYRKTGHPQNAEQAQGWQETGTNDTLNAFDNGEARIPTVVVTKKATVYDWHRQDTRMTECGDVCVTAAAGWGGGGNNMPYVLEETVEDGAFCVGNGQVDQTKLQKKVGTLNCMHDQQAVMVPDVSHSLKAKANCQYREDSETYACTAVDCRNGTEESISGSMQASANHNLNSNNVCRQGYIVRRLTPTECERLQGYPDGWTDIGEWTDSKGKRHKDADSPRYKALGNSIALPFWCWMAERMVQYLVDTPTMASLFDGIGGFPFAFSRVGCTPVWASEIEEFPIAVTKIRFPE